MIESRADFIWLLEITVLSRDLLWKYPDLIYLWFEQITNISKLY